jgi:hypothetical protein
MAFTLLSSLPFFSFTFQFSVPGIPNPFSAQETPVLPDQTPQNDKKRKDIGFDEPRRSSSPLNPHPNFPMSRIRKRGWAPSFTEPSCSAPAIAAESPAGIIDTPRDIVMWDGQQHVLPREDNEDEKHGEEEEEEDQG